MDNERRHQLVNILWTGGYDSSFRMIQLSKYDVKIQPYYISDNRVSEDYELKAIYNITEDILRHPETRCSILPLIIIKVNDIEPDQEITEAYLRLRKQTSIGSQYDWLARFAKQINGLELGLEKAETSKAQNCILMFGNVKLITEENISYYILDKKKSHKDLLKVFGDFHFPYPLFDLTKLEIKEEYIRLGFTESVYKTWFCFTPIDGEPCGFCNPCKSAIEEGMNFRFSKAGLKRYKYRFIYKNIHRVKRKLFNKEV